ncbi:aldose 1-epimerase [Streptomyces sp. TRM 70351]|uniref:aldose epimerase family protein n=1 Tax=Streptomyces sp. TRM 70351 TaxID=3116552 RepID=UPI002E7AC4F3|nr:aldose 1-epimerase [Streptomyces sp. TRM 70351]MEE1929887.1 aldose 1-epimerase [Streptomyces sp. TRM 70351]
MTTQTTDVRLAAGDAHVTVEPHHGCRIASLSVGGTELLRQGEEYGSFVMVPWCGRTDRGRFRHGADTYQLPIDAAPHAMHGLAREGRWRTVRADERSAAFTWELGDPWPWSGTVTQLVELAEDGSALTLTLGVETAADSFPAQVGWHPWFRRNLGTGEDVRIGFTPQWQEERGDDHLPTGRRIEPRPGPWDDCFGMPDGVDVTLTWPQELELRVTSRAEWVVVYDEQEAAVCVEPQTGPPNGLNTHPALVTPISPVETTTTWAWRRPQDR